MILTCKIQFENVCFLRIIKLYFECTHFFQKICLHEVVTSFLMHFGDSILQIYSRLILILELIDDVYHNGLFSLVNMALKTNSLLYTMAILYQLL